MTRHAHASGAVKWETGVTYHTTFTSQSGNSDSKLPSHFYTKKNSNNPLFFVPEICLPGLEGSRLFLLVSRIIYVNIYLYHRPEANFEE